MEISGRSPEERNDSGTICFPPSFGPSGRVPRPDMSFNCIGRATLFAEVGRGEYSVALDWWELSD